MGTIVEKKKKMPVVLPHGAFNEIARRAGSNRNTASTAIRKNSPGPIAEKCRQIARELYGVEE